MRIYPKYHLVDRHTSKGDEIGKDENLLCFGLEK